MRDVIEERKTRTSRAFEVDDIQCRRTLIQTIAVTTSVEAQQHAEKEADGRFVGYDDDLRLGVGDYDVGSSAGRSSVP